MATNAGPLQPLATLVLEAKFSYHPNRRVDLRCSKFGPLLLSVNPWQPPRTGARAVCEWDCSTAQNQETLRLTRSALCHQGLS